MTINEFDEQMTDRENAIRILDRKIKLYRRGEESLGVVDAYELAALRAGCPVYQIAALWEANPPSPSYQFDGRVPAKK